MKGLDRNICGELEDAPSYKGSKRVIHGTKLLSSSAENIEAFCFGCISLSRRLVLQTNSNDGLTLWGRARHDINAAILSLEFFAQGFLYAYTS